MAGEVYRPRRLRERGVRIAIPIEDPDVWQRRVKADPGLPKSYDELRDLVERRFSGRGYIVSSADALPDTEEQPFTDRTCGESLYARIYGGLANPWLASEERDSIEAVLAEATPTDWKSRDDFPHFILRWTETDPNPANNLDPEHARELIAEAGALLEQAWQSLTAAFGRPPFGSEGGNKIQVDFQDLPDDKEGQANPPEGPIVFDAEKWQASTALRAPLAAHELFHKLQYAFGFRLDWEQASFVEWFSEGTARWAEVFVHQRLTNSRWLLEWMLDPNLNFFAMSSMSLPFWLFFDAQFHPQALLKLLQSCKDELGAQSGLDQVLLDAGHDLPEFFQQFAIAIKVENGTREWRRPPSGQVLYPQILDENGQPIEPQVGTTTQTLSQGEIYSSPEPIPLGSLAACYHAFTFQAAADGRPLRIEARSGQDLTYQLILLRGGHKVSEIPPVVSADFVNEQAIQLAIADTLLFIASSRGARTTIEVSAQVG